MELKIAVLAKQVIDPEMPMAAFQVDSNANKVVTPPNIPPVVNGFDENAVEAALLLKDAQEATITVISSGTEFALDVMKKPLSMGADELILLQDDAFGNTIDSFFTAQVLAEAVRKLEGFDLIICGRQASDWDNAHVPLGLSETLGIPCLTEAKNIEIGDDYVTVNSSRTDGYEVFEANLPALITVNNEIGQPRYPTLRGIMQASRKTPEILTLSDLGLSEEDVEPAMTLSDLYIPISEAQCEIVEGEDDADSGRLLALKLREAKII